MTDVNVDLAGRISGIESVEIEDVLLVRLDHFKDSRGQILKIWRDDSPIMADWKMGILTAPRMRGSGSPA